MVLGLLGNDWQRVGDPQHAEQRRLLRVGERLGGAAGFGIGLVELQFLGLEGLVLDV